VVLIDKSKLTEFGVRLLVTKGVGEEKARYLAATAVATEAMGVHTHGVVLFRYWHEKVGTDIDPSAEPEVVKQTPAAATVDGHGGFGQLAIRLARELAVEKATSHGIAMVAGRHMAWLGALGVHILPLAEAGLFAQAWAHTNTCKDSAPWGGIDARFSTNPIALAFPTGGLPMLGDFSTSALSIGRTHALAAKGERTPENLYMDKHGTPTNDPSVFDEGGSLFFTGGEHYGYRGYALSLWVEALTAMSGSSANNPELPTTQCFNLTVIDPAAFAGADSYLAEMRRFVAHVKASRLRPGFSAILLPGERAQRAAQEAETRGVPVDDKLVGALNEVAERAGLERL